MKLMKVIAFLLVTLLLVNCQAEKKTVKNYDLPDPDEVEHPEVGILDSISPEELIKKLNSGERLDMYYLKQTEPSDPSHFVDIPGMKHVHLGDMFYISETLKTEDPVYLISIYGNDSRKMGEEILRNGLDCIYLDGGTYMLGRTMQEKNLHFNSTAKISTTTPGK